MKLDAICGDLTRFPCDAVVNAANRALAGGGGLDGAIHRAAGPALMDACRALPANRGVRCPTGEARATPAFEVPARWILHAVGPVYGDEREHAALLASAYRSSLSLAERLGARTVGLPALSCGVFGYPPAEAAPISVAVCLERSWDLDQVTFVLSHEHLRARWAAEIARALGGPEEHPAVS